MPVPAAARKEVAAFDLSNRRSQRGPVKPNASQGADGHPGVFLTSSPWDPPASHGWVNLMGKSHLFFLCALGANNGQDINS